MNSKDFDYKEDLAGKVAALKEIEGFPIGEYKDIISLSEPPFYTACPNPYITDFTNKYGVPYDEATDNYHCVPFIGDVSEGKNNPIYNAHSYHTKVPHKAIEHFINHYTSENDLILDAFSGTGMTGIAASNLNRKTILIDLAPASTFISTNYNHLSNGVKFLEEFNKIYEEVENELGWVYKTKHYSNTSSDLKFESDQIMYGIINYTVWSDVLICPICNTEFEYFAVDRLKDENKVFKCPSCDAVLKKNNCIRAKTSVFDSLIGKNIEINKQVPVLINYTYNKKRFEKRPDKYDLELLDKIQNLNSSYWIPIYKMLFKDGAWGDIYRTGYHFGVTHAHHFYTKRNLLVIAALWAKTSNRKIRWSITSILNYVNKRQSFSGGGGGMPGVLFIASLVQEKNVFDVLNRKVKKISSLLNHNNANDNVIVSTQSATDLKNLNNSTIDYIFTDPPFGDNIMYSEASFLWESWLKIFTNNTEEAIINTSQNKYLNNYFGLMLKAFKEYYRVLKPNRWITVVFHNSKSSVWNVIQESMSKAGFIIAQVSVLDKQQGSFKQVTSPGAVEKDLIISAYKPTKSFEERFLKQAGENLEIDFIYQFLANVPQRPAIERTDKMLYSKMLAYYIQRGYEVRHDSKSFYRLFQNNFISEDGYWFNSDQISSYRAFKQKVKIEGIEDIKQGAMILFIIDENSSIIWLYNFLSEQKSFSDIRTAYNQISEIQGDNVPELQSLLDDNFVFENNKYRRPQGDSEKTSLTDKRERALMKVFESILIEAKNSKKKISLVRKEALLYGFETCYKQNRFEDILVTSNRLDSSIVENSTEINDFITIARIKVEGIK